VASSGILSGFWTNLVWGAVLPFTSFAHPIYPLTFLVFPIPPRRENLFEFFLCIMFSGWSVPLSVVRSSVNTYSAWCDSLSLFTQWMEWADLNETRRKYASREWILLKRFSGSEFYVILCHRLYQLCACTSVTCILKINQSINSMTNRIIVK